MSIGCPCRPACARPTWAAGPRCTGAPPWSTRAGGTRCWPTTACPAGRSGATPGRPAGPRPPRGGPWPGGGGVRVAADRAGGPVGDGRASGGGVGVGDADGVPVRGRRRLPEPPVPGAERRDRAHPGGVLRLGVAAGGGLVGADVRPVLPAG